MKNKILIFSLFMFVFLFGCNKLGREINTQFIDFNIEEDYSKIEKTKYIDYYKVNYEIYNSSSLPLITVKSGDAYGIYSILKNKLIFDFSEGITIDYIFTYYFPNYFKVIYSDGDIELYDYNGVILLEKDNYQNLNVQVQRSREKNNWVYKEIIDYTLNGKDFTVIYQSVNDISKRKLFDDNEDFIQGDKITFIPNGVDMEELGLPGYYFIELNDNYIQVYNPKNQLVSTVNLNFDYQYAVSFAGCIIYQKVLLLDADEKEYDYAVEVNNSLLKYDLITYKLDLLSSNIEELDVDFIISDGFACKDKQGVFNYANVKIRLIENKRLIPVQQFIIDEECNIIYNFSNAISLESLIRLDSDHYFDYQSNKLYNSKMDLLFDFNNNNQKISFVGFDFGHKLIKCKHNEKFGFINYNLEVIIPFQYDKLSDYFISDAVYGSIENVNYLININGSNAKTNLLMIENYPLLYNVKEEDSYCFEFFTYDNKKILTFNTNTESLPTIYKINFNDQSYYYFIFKEKVEYNGEDVIQDIIFTVVTNDNYD